MPYLFFNYRSLRYWLQPKKSFLEVCKCFKSTAKKLSRSIWPTYVWHTMHSEHHHHRNLFRSNLYYGLNSVDAQDRIFLRNAKIWSLTFWYFTSFHISFIFLEFFLNSSTCNVSWHKFIRFKYANFVLLSNHNKSL